MRIAPLRYTLLLVALFSSSGKEPAGFLQLLQKELGIDQAELSRKLRNGVIATTLPHSRSGEVAAAATMRITVPLDFFIENFRDISAFKSDPAIRQIKKFGDPPTLQDLEPLTLPEGEISQFTKCRPGDCGLKMSAEMIRSLNTADTNAGHIEKKYRMAIWSYISVYLKNGTRSMIEYADKQTPMAMSDQFRVILAETGWLSPYAAPLLRALNAPYEATTASGIEEFLYWSREEFGLKPVVSVTHVFIYRTVIDGHKWAFLATKQIYANHYINASLGLTILAEESADPAKPLLLVAYFNRSETDGLRGWLASIQRSVLEGRMRNGMGKNFTSLAERLENAHKHHTTLRNLPAQPKQ